VKSSNSSKKQLIQIAKKIIVHERISPQQMQQMLSFELKDKESGTISILKKAAVPTAILVGFLIAVFPDNAQVLVSALPAWTLMPDPMVRGADYIWSIIGEPVGKNSILYHLPNIILYSFGVLGVKKLFDVIDRKTWIDKVNFAKKNLVERLEGGTLPLLFKKGHSVLFVGNGDFIGTQFVKDSAPDRAVIVGAIRPSVTNAWNYYNADEGFESLRGVFERVCGKDTGEYIFFPVKDDQVFLPGPKSYDLSPHRLDILCQDIRTIEKKNKWKPKRIIIVGDRFHESFVQSEDEKKKVSKSEDTISLQSISDKYSNVTVIDPTELVLKEVLGIAKGRKIVLRATRDGINEYKNRFYQRLYKLGYKTTEKKGILTIGYDLFEDQTEQQTLSRKIDDYYPVVLSQAVADALIRNGYRKDEFIYVPELVLRHLGKKASEQ